MLDTTPVEIIRISDTITQPVTPVTITNIDELKNELLDNYVEIGSETFSAGETPSLIVNLTKQYKKLKFTISYGKFSTNNGILTFKFNNNSDTRRSFTITNTNAFCYDFTFEKNNTPYIETFPSIVNANRTVGGNTVNQLQQLVHNITDLTKIELYSSTSALTFNSDVTIKVWGVEYVGS